MEDNKNQDSGLYNGLSRREFMQKAVVWTGAALLPLSALLQSCETFEEVVTPASGQYREVDINDIDDVFRMPILQFVGWGRYERFHRMNYGIPVIIIRIKEELEKDSFICFSSMCTHAHCFGENNITGPLAMEAGNELIICGCHGSKFNPFEGGRVIQGPAEKPLKQFKAEYIRDDVNGKDMVRIYF